MIISDSSKFDCKTCILTKQVNVRNKQPDIQAICPFELVHTYLARTTDPISKDRFKYVISFTDYFCGCLFTYFLKEKSDAVNASKRFLVFGKIKTLSFYDDVFSSGKVKHVCSDNGRKCLSKAFQDLTSLYSPQQNGTAEQNWHILFDMTRSMLLESSLPKYLWILCCYEGYICSKWLLLSAYKQHTVWGNY